MNQRDYYEVLEISRTAGEKEIRQAYRKLAMKYHPDRNPDDAEAEVKFREAAEAYEVLRDPEKRARYDRFGHAGVQGGSAGGFGSAEDIFAHFSDIFGDLFGFSTGSRGPQPEPGHDLRYNLTISFQQAAHGDKVSLKLPKHINCPDCKGTGAAPDGKVTLCQHCKGTGQTRRSQGFFHITIPCPACKGSGQTITRPCPRCKGNGLVQDTREILVTIPAGVDNGTRLRVRNEGEPGLHGGPAGDLYVVLSVEPDARWQREGADLIYHQELTFVQAALGHKVEVPGINGPLEIQIPEGAQSGTYLTVTGEGMPYPGRKERGDLLISLQVLTPTRLSDRQKELLKEFEQEGEQGFFATLKEGARKLGKAMGLD